MSTTIVLSATTLNCLSGHLHIMMTILHHSEHRLQYRLAGVLKPMYKSLLYTNTYWTWCKLPTQHYRTWYITMIKLYKVLVFLLHTIVPHVGLTPAQRTHQACCTSGSSWPTNIDKPTDQNEKPSRGQQGPHQAVQHMHEPNENSISASSLLMDIETRISSKEEEVCQFSRCSKCKICDIIMNSSTIKSIISQCQYKLKHLNLQV